MRTWLATSAGTGSTPPPLPTQAWIDTAFEILGLADGITTAFCGGNVRRRPVLGRKAAFRAHITWLCGPRVLGFVEGERPCDVSLSTRSTSVSRHGRAPR